VTPELVQLLRRWLPSQRWYPAKGREAELLHLGERQLTAPDRAVDIVVHIVGLDCGDHLDVV
jgi:1,4-alpha-glucan branching enzyme